MQLNLQLLNDAGALKDKGYQLPNYDVAALRARTKDAPCWVHFGAGNLFRAFIAAGADEAIGKGSMDKGIIACASVDEVEGCYKPFDALCVDVSLGADGTAKRRIVGCVADAIALGDADTDAVLTKIMCDPGLQMCSFTITEKGYDPKGAMMASIAKWMYARYKAGAHALALVSMDNCARNGAVLKAGVLAAADAYGDAGFTAYLNDETKIGFPWSMIDKITPRPDPAVQQMLEGDGFTDMQIKVTARGAHMAPFVNSERVGYLVIEDSFPNGRPDLSACGFLMADRKTVASAERMKVCTCLNPLHTALAVFGCLLSYERIYDEMKDAELVALVNRLGWVEGMPVVTNPGILDPKEFLTACLTERFPNAFLPDAPQRIAMDTSQKLAIRFGETLKAYMASDELSADDLRAVPLVYAGWMRYLTGIDDEGKVFERSPDPMLAELEPIAAHLRDRGADFDEAVIQPLMKNASVLGVDLYEAGIAPRVIADLRAMLKGAGAVRSTIKQEVEA